MSNLTLYPVEDWYESKLSQPYNWTDSTIYVDTIPVGTLALWQKVIFTINPWTSYAQAIEVSWWSAGQLIVSSTTVEKANGTNYTTRQHGAKSPIIMSDNFANWEAITTAVNSKSDTASPAFTGYVWLPTYADVTARNTAIPSPTGKELVIVAGDLQHYNSTISQREIADTGTPTPNASTTVSGKVEEATQAEVEAGTDTGWTWARNFITPSKINPANITSATIATDDKISFSDISDSNKLKSWTILDIASIVSRFGGDRSDWVQWDANLTITGSNNTYITKNFSSWTAWSTTRTCTVTPTWCIVHIKIKGNADFTNWTFDFSGKGAAWGASKANWSSSPVILQSSPNLWGTTWLVGLWQYGGGWWSWSWANWSTIGGAWWIKWSAVPLTSIQWKRAIEIACGAWWAGWRADSWETGGTWGTWWGVLIIEVLWNITLNNSTTIVNMNWTAGTAWSNIGGNRAWGGWGGWGGCFYLMHNWTLTWTCTPTFAWGAWGATWTGQSSSWWAGWAGWAGLALIEQNKVFS